MAGHTTPLYSTELATPALAQSSPRTVCFELVSLFCRSVSVSSPTLISDQSAPRVTAQGGGSYGGLIKSTFTIPSTVASPSIAAAPASVASPAPVGVPPIQTAAGGVDVDTTSPVKIDNPEHVLTPVWQKIWKKRFGPDPAGKIVLVKDPFHGRRK